MKGRSDKQTDRQTDIQPCGRHDLPHGLIKLNCNSKILIPCAPSTNHDRKLKHMKIILIRMYVLLLLLMVLFSSSF